MKNYMKIFWFTAFHTKPWLERKPSCISFEKIDGFIRIYDRNRYLMFGSEKYDAIYNGTKSFKVVKNGVTKLFSGFCSKIKVDSHDSLPIETDWPYIML